MPVPQLEKMAKEAEVTLEHAEEVWNESKKYADTKFKIKNDEDRNEHYWAYVSYTTKAKLGLIKKEK